MDGIAGPFPPRRFSLREEFEPFSSTPLHFHHVGDDMNCAGMMGVEGQGATRHLFGAAILAILFEAESVQRKDAGVARSRRIPLRKHLGDAISKHAPLASPEIKG